VSSTSSTSGTSGTLGNVPPVSFPGISSGIDYNSIIQKYTADTLQQEKPSQTQINNLNAQNTAILKITNLIGSVQDSLTALSDPTTFGAFKATVGNTSTGSPSATATQISGQQPIAGTYTINAQTVATATVLKNSATANGTLNTGVALDAAGTAITATNGTASNGKFTLNGVAINYDVATNTITQIVSTLNTVLSSTGGSAVLNANGTVSLTGVTSLGSGGDSGNLEQVLKLDTAQIVGGNVTSSSGIAGLNATSLLNQNNNAGFATAVTSGTFTINGVSFTVDTTTESLTSVISAINSSAAGVTATYNSQTSSLSLTNKTPGPQSILIGAGTDTSNFLNAAGLSSGSGGTTTAGSQASLSYTDSGGLHTVYSATNDFTSVIPGVDLNISTSSPAGSTGTYYTVNVAADPTKAEAAIGTFIKAYNAAITELNNDTVAPTVSAGTDSTTSTATSTSQGGGVLYGNFQISGLRDQLVNLVSGFVPSGSTSYNSLASVGILLDTSSQTVGASDSTTDASTSDSTNSANNSFSVNATSGRLAALDTTTFEAAYASNTSAIQALFTASPALSGGQPAVGATYGFSYQFGSTLANVDGLATFLKGSVITPASLTSVLLTSITDSNNQQIDSLEQQIALINQEATSQADSLRQQFSASEAQIAQLQSLQSQISAIGH
jgi:flagellar hook-associated protein 2